MSIVVNDKQNGRTKLKYGSYPKKDGDVPTPRDVGPLDRAGPPFRRVLYGFEVLYPVNSACPTKAKQFVKSTVKYTTADPNVGEVTSTVDYPAGDPSASPQVPGGFAGSSYSSDGPPGGPDAAGRVTSTDGTDNGYYDSPGLALGDKNSFQHAPATYDASFLIVLIDCHDNVIETLAFDIHIAVDANGNVVKCERGNESKPAFNADKPIDKSGLPIK